MYPISLTSENYPALTIQAREILDTSKAGPDVKAPFISDIFMLDVLTEFLNSPLYFLSYIDRRVGYQEKIGSINEFAILGYHLKKNLWFEDDVELVMVDESFSVDLDTAFSIRRRNLPGNDMPQGILTKYKNTYVGKLINSIESSPHPELINLGFTLLKLGEETVLAIEQGVSQLRSASLRDDQHHDFSIAFGTGDEGLTIHCNDLGEREARSKLQEHCARRKYVTKADKWFGLSIRKSDGRPRFGVHLKVNGDSTPEWKGQQEA